VLDERAIPLERLLELLAPVRRAEAAPRDEVGARRDRIGRVDLQQGQLLDDLHQLGRTRRREQLRAHDDAPACCLVSRCNA